MYYPSIKIKYRGMLILDIILVIKILDKITHFIDPYILIPPDYPEDIGVCLR